MSSLYKSLSDEDLKIEKESLKNFEKKLRETSSGGSALKVAVIGAFVISLISLIGSASLYQSLNKEKRQREALEAAQIQIREKAAAFEQDAEKSKTEMAKLSEQIKKYSTVRQEIAQELATSRKEVTELRTKLKEIEERSLAMQAQTEEEQTDFESQPAGPEFSGEETEAGEAEAADAGQKSVIATEPAVIQDPQILSVNKKFNFFVANVGLKNNVEIGDTLEVVRGNKTIASATVEKIYDNFSAATIQNQSKDTPIKEGDSVRKV